MATVQEIENILLARGFQDDLFSSLSGARKKERGGRETRCNCPFCDDTGGHFSYSSERPLWKCWKCHKEEGGHGNWFGYLGLTRGLDFKEALRYLAEQAGVELASSEEDSARYVAYTRRASVLDAAHQLFIHDIWLDTKCAKEINYLRDRGYSDEDIKGMQLGAYVDRNKLQVRLVRQGYTATEIKDSGLLTQGFGETHTITTLWPDATGRAIGLACRSIMPAEELKAAGLQKYKYSLGLEKNSGLIGFSSVRGSEQLVLVEGLLDALLLNSRGFKAVATGGTSLSAGQLKAMESTGTRELVLAMDMDEPGRQATERIIRSLSSSRLRLYVVDTGKFKDADELLREEGAGAFQQCLDKAERASRWYAGLLVSQQDIKTARGMDRAIDNVLGYSAGLVDGIDRRDAEAVLKQTTGLTDEELALRKRQHEQQASSRQAQAALKSTLREFQQKVEQEDITGAEQLLEDGLERIRRSRGVEAPEPYGLAVLLRDISSSSPGLETGYASIDGLAKIPEGAITVVAGRPGHGKTAFMANCLLNQVAKYPDKKFYFFSYEESRARLAVRLLMILAGEVIMADRNKGEYLYYLKRGREGIKRPTIETAIKTFDDYTSSSRLVLVDRMPPAEDLASTIEHICRRQDVGAIYVDYIQKVSLRRPQSQRYLDIKQASQLLLGQAVSQNVPVIVGAQLGRPPQGHSNKWQATVSLDNLRESGDIEQDTNLVLGLWNEVAGADPEEEAAITTFTRVAELKVACLKSRDSQPGWTKTLNFEGATQRISETQFQQAKW